MLNNKDRRLLENKIYKILKESLYEGDFFYDSFMQNEKKGEKDSDKKSKKHKDKKEDDSGDIKLSDYEDLDQNTYGKLKSIVPILLSTYDDSVNTYNFTHSQLAYEMYPDLDPDTARSKFSQKVTGKKRFTSKEINTLFNVISGKIA